jgi:gliding motility-associated-like protein
MKKTFKLICYTTLFYLLSANLYSQSIGGVTSGATYFCDSINSGFISLNSYSGSILMWQSSINNGVTWNNISNNTSTQSYNNLNKSTKFRAIVKNGTSNSDTSSISTIDIHIPGTVGVINGGGVFCSNSGSGTITLTGITGTVVKWESALAINGIWTSIPNTTASQSYPNLTQNAFYRAIIQSFSGCPNDTTSIASFIVDQNTVAGSILKSDSVCYGSNGDTLVLLGNVGQVIDWQSSNNAGLTWVSQGNTSNQEIYNNLTETLMYKAIIKNGACITLTTSPVSITLYNINPANAGNDLTITRYEPVTLNGSGVGNAEWSPSATLDNPTQLITSASPLFTTTYSLKLTDTYSCVSYDTVIVNVGIPIPTAITPNNDNVNDYFQIYQVESYPNNSISIFNRWGNIVYKEAPYTNNWYGKSQNGNDLPDDIYYVLFDYGTGDKPYNNYILIKR